MRRPAVFYTVSLRANTLRFWGYPFTPASVHPLGAVRSASISAVSTKRSPPEVWLTSGETLFVPAPSEERLCSFASANAIPDRPGTDVWALILEPFVDTWFDEAHHRQTLRTLEECGLASTSVETLRERVRDLMIAYNFDSGLWDWCHLGLFDLLSAGSGSLVPRRLAWSSREMREYYWAYLRIAEQGHRGLDEGRT